MSTKTRDYFFYTEIITHNIEETTITLSIIFIFFIILLLYFLIFNYNTNNFEVMPLTLITILLYIGIGNINNNQIEIGYYALLGAILFDIVVIIILNKVNLLNIGFIDLKDKKNIILKKLKNEPLESLDIEIKQEENKIKNYRIIAVILFIFTPIATNIGLKFPQILQNEQIRFNDINSILTMGLSLIFRKNNIILLEFLISYFFLELFILITICCFFLNKWPKFPNKALYKTILVYFLLIIGIFCLLVVNVTIPLLNFIYYPFITFLIFPFFIIPLLMIDKSISDPKIGIEGIFLIFTYSIMIFVSIFILNGNLLGIPIREFDSVINTELRPTLIVLFIPILASYLLNEGKKLE